MKIETKQSIRYLLILAVNFTVLLLLLYLWTDSLELIIDRGSRAIEFLKVSALSFLALIVIAIFSKVSTKTPKEKLKSTALIVLILHSYLYFDYIKNTIRHCVTSKVVRESASQKVKDLYEYTYSYKGKNLSNQEYREIHETTWLPAITEGESINFSYKRFDSLLPDSELIIEYYLPLKAQVEEWHEESDQHKYFQKAEKVGDKQKVTYMRSMW